MHPNEKVIRDCLSTVFNPGEAEKGGDVIGDGKPKGLEDLITDDFVAYVPGRHQLSGVYHGKTEAIDGWLGRLLKLTDNTLHVEVHEVFGNGRFAAAIYTYSAERNGRRLAWRSASIYEIRDGKMAKEWMHHAEQHELDAFLGTGREMEDPWDF